jgi:lipopolysaccharide cholinephosphotransferase
MAELPDTDTCTYALRAWETLLCAVAEGAQIPAFCEPSGQTVDPDRLIGLTTQYHIRRTAANALIVSPNNPKKTLMSALRLAVRYEELSRTQKYTYVQMSPQDVRRSQLLALSMLRECERICIKHGLTYYVAAGSLLGAVRHHGQIPWDDDVDVTMPRKDYDKFIQIAQTELPDTMILPKNNFPYGFHRMQLKGTNIERTLRQKGHHGIFLDILPLDGAAPTPKKKALHDKINARLMFYMFEHARPIPPLNQFRTNKRLFIKRIIIKLFGSKRLLHFLWEQNAKRYDVDTASEWVCLPGSYGYEKECFPKEYWGEPDYLEYEHKLCPVMREWDAYLRLHYGDYMQCPAELEKRTHLLFSIDFGPYADVPTEELEQSVLQRTQEVSAMTQNVEAEGETLHA